MAERFFRGTALAGDLHLIDLNDWAAWDAEQIKYRDETEASWLTRVGGNEHRMIRTSAELDAALQESVTARVFHLYIREDLLEQARQRREEMQRKRKP